jgi:hypothetical protein
MVPTREIIILPLDWKGRDPAKTSAIVRWSGGDEGTGG